MKIRDIRATPVNIPLTAPWRFGYGSIASLTKTAVEVVAEDGVTGLGEVADGDRSAEVASLTGGNAKQLVYRDWWQPVVSMSFDDPDQEPPRLHWPNHVRVQLPYPRVWITAYRNDAPNGTSGVFLAGRQPDRERLLGLLEPLDELVTALPEGTVVGKGGVSGKLSIYTERPNRAFVTDDACRGWLRSTLNKYVNILRPSVKRLMLDH